MASDNAWQFRYVPDHGPTTDRIVPVASSAPLQSERKVQPVGATVDTFNGPETIDGPYIELSVGVPEDTEGFTWDGNVRVLRHGSKFPRDVELGDSTPGAIIHDTSWVVGQMDRGDRYTILDDEVGEPGGFWYYTVFYGNSETGNHAYSPVWSHTRNYAYRNEVDELDEGQSQIGLSLYDLLPRWVRRLDLPEQTTYRVLQIVGKMLDTIEEDIDYHTERLFDVDSTDAADLPYIDWLLAWPTNYELPEDKRRVETSQAVSLWKSKGTKSALKQILQTISGWEVEVADGWRWVLSTPNVDEVYNGMAMPSGWDNTPVNQGGDGIWADLIGDMPANETFDSTRADLRTNVGLPKDKNSYTPSVIEGTGESAWSWQTSNGLLIALRRLPSSPNLTETVVRKLNRMAPIFVPHFQEFMIAIIGEHEETLDIIESDEDVSTNITVEELFDLHYIDQTTAVVPEKCLFYTYPHPNHPDECVLGNASFLTFHSDFEYGCEPDDEVVISNAYDWLLPIGIEFS